MTAITEALADVRTRTGLTDDALARVIGVRQATFTRWRNGTLSVADRHAARLANLLGMTAADVAKMLRDQQRAANAIEKGTIGHLLRQFEQKNGLNPQGAYEKLGVDVSTYHKWRKNQVVPGPSVIASLAAGLGVSEQVVVMAVYRTELWRLAQKGS
jgi:transcriptional regulator with XRE-family HTH domain